MPTRSFTRIVLGLCAMTNRPDFSKRAVAMRVAFTKATLARHDCVVH